MSSAKWRLFRFGLNELTHSFDVYADVDLCHICSGDGLLPGGSKSLPEPLLT